MIGFASSIVLHHLRGQEVFRYSIAEAAKHALPVVSTINNEILENVVNRETVYLVLEYSYELMGEKIIHLGNNLHVVERIGKAR